MSKADWTYLDRAITILKKGSWDNSMPVRPKWPDNTIAHTIGVFSDFQRYNLAEEFPIVELRDTNWRSAIEEILWIYQRKDNNINNFASNVWNQWADKEGSIGKAYGFQVAQKYNFPEGYMDQMDHVLYLLKNDPANRRNVLSLWNAKDLKEMSLQPCAYLFQPVIKDNKLNFFLNQRSNDLLAAGNWNVAQYAALAQMLAQVTGYELGELTHHVSDSHIYDRHVPFVVYLVLTRLQTVEERVKSFSKKMSEEQHDFVDMLHKFDTEHGTNRLKNLTDGIHNLHDLLKVSTHLDKLLEEAEYLQTNTTDYQEYTKKIIDSKAFEIASRVVDIMKKNSDIEKALGFSTPRLVLEKNIDDFYSFKTPKIRDENRKIINNPESSFSVEDYHPEVNGVKFKVRVPIAE